MIDRHTHYPQSPGIWDVVPALLNSLRPSSDAQPVATTSLQLPQAGSGMVILVDGLGIRQLVAYSSYAPTLRQMLTRQGDHAAATGGAPTEISTVLPTTTASALTSMATGLLPGRHGLVGYDSFDPDRGQVINQLGNWDPEVNPEQWQPHPTLFESVQAPLAAVTVSLPEFADSGLTRAGLRGPRFVGARSLGARFHKALTELQRPGALVYLYIPELDKAGHRHGVGSAEWIEVLEAIDSHMRRLRRKLSTIGHPVNVLLTADHGMVTIAPADRLDTREHSELYDGVLHTAGEPRFFQLYFAPEADDSHRREIQQRWEKIYGEVAIVISRDRAEHDGWFGPLEPRVVPRIGDLLVVAQSDIALYDSLRASAMSWEMWGHHGSTTDDERLVPLLVID
ncbi:alkaline phosphatase family protein [Auritidibacter ignavus]|uniref:Alkaline phosphatase family protein n=1 Tax=Auritidibacter ignavus TaxID=678932 RepID=A0AAJ6AIK7_9MICC|nr:alkaline phosphatase family protein [Auritidibacter ignavus]WGH93935.1 alkaline phosphatase family protein [Auritidibacter ignavus]